MCIGGFVAAKNHLWPLFFSASTTKHTEDVVIYLNLCWFGSDQTKSQFQFSVVSLCSLSLQNQSGSTVLKQKNSVKNETAVTVSWVQRQVRTQMQDTESMMQFITFIYTKLLMRLTCTYADRVQTPVMIHIPSRQWKHRATQKPSTYNDDMTVFCMGFAL